MSNSGDQSAAPEAEPEQTGASVEELQRRLEETTDALDAARRALALSLSAQHDTLLQVADDHVELQRLQAALAELRASEAYRVGLAVTWPARHAKRRLGGR